MGLGFAKVASGEARDKPVEFLVALIAVTLLFALAMAAQLPPVSREGRRTLSIFRGEHERAIRAPRPEEVIAAFAVTGAAVLAGTTFESYGELLTGAKDSGSGGCGGAGDGGGGCGGCSG